MKIVRRQYLILFLLFILFAAPGLSAYVLFAHPQWLRAPTTNRGALLQPPVLLTQLGDDSKWRLILWSPMSCDGTCVSHMDQLARIRLALGRRLYDVDTTLLLGADADPISSVLTGRLQALDVHVIRLSAKETAGLLENQGKPTFFIANPTHFLVLSYPLSVASDAMFHDIKQLLGTSSAT